MTTATVRIQNETGLHARPAALFTKCAKGFCSAVQVRRPSDADYVNAKSLILLLSKGFCLGDEIEICASGEDEAEAVRALSDLILFGGLE